MLRLSQLAEQTSTRRAQLDEELAELDAQLEDLNERRATGEAKFEELDMQLATTQERHAELDEGVITAERKLAEAQWDKVELRNPVKLYNPRTLAERPGAMAAYRDLRCAGACRVSGRGVRGDQARFACRGDGAGRWYATVVDCIRRRVAAR